MPCENSLDYNHKETHQTWLRMKTSPETALWYWLSFLFLGRTNAGGRLLYLCNETISARVCFWGETNKDNYCRRIPFMLRATCVSGESTCCSRSSVGPLGRFFYVFYLYQTAENSPLPIRPAASSRRDWNPLHVGLRLQRIDEGGRRGEEEKRRETAAVGERRSSSILMCANSPAPAD